VLMRSASFSIMVWRSINILTSRRPLHYSPQYSNLYFVVHPSVVMQVRFLERFFICLSFFFPFIYLFIYIFLCKDVVVHRQLLGGLAEPKRDQLFNNENLGKLASHINKKHRASKFAQKDSTQLFQVFYFKDRQVQVT